MNKEHFVKELQTMKFSQTDAEEVVELIIKEEGENIKDIINLWDCFGYRWNDEEVVEYMNEGSERKITLKEILTWNNFFRLKSGLIISWKY